MSIDKVKKTELIDQFSRSKNDTGSPEVQVAILTERIKNLTASAPNWFIIFSGSGLKSKSILIIPLLTFLYLIDFTKYIVSISNLMVLLGRIELMSLLFKIQ